MISPTRLAVRSAEIRKKIQKAAPSERERAIQEGVAELTSLHEIYYGRRPPPTRPAAIS